MSNTSNTTFYAYLDAEGTQLVKLYGDPSIWMSNETESDSSILTEFGRSEDMDFLWVLYAGVMVFFMQSGFTLLEAGMVRVTSVQNILFKVYNIYRYICIFIFVYITVGFNISLLI